MNSKKVVKTTKEKKEKNVFLCFVFFFGVEGWGKGMKIGSKRLAAKRNPARVKTFSKKRSNKELVLFLCDINLVKVVCKGCGTMMRCCCD
jgi:hypothetical protein